VKVEVTEVVEVAEKENKVPFKVGGCYRDGDGEYFLLTKLPDDRAYVWVNLSTNRSSSVVDEASARDTASGIEYLDGFKVHLTKEAFV
jgi:hypothetical protein